MSTHAGIEQLTGITGNVLERERAGEIALAVRGVRGQGNALVVATTSGLWARCL